MEERLKRFILKAMTGESRGNDIKHVRWGKIK